MRRMDFQHENHFSQGETYEVTEHTSVLLLLCLKGKHALGISKNFKNAERLKTTTGTVGIQKKRSRLIL